MTNPASKSAYAFILCDIRKPGINGLDFHTRVQEKDRKTAPKIIFITGDTANKATRDFVEEKKVHCLRNPFELSDLQEVMMKAGEEEKRLPVRSAARISQGL